MGVYLNPGDDLFGKSFRSPIYIDKSMIIDYLNKVIDTEMRFVCVSRPRRFGKSMAAHMISAYYDRSTTAQEKFAQLKIARVPSYTEHLGKYDVIKLNVQSFLSRSDNSIDNVLNNIQKRLLQELCLEYENVHFFNADDLVEVMLDIYNNTKRLFIIIVDEWDCIFREYAGRKDWQDKYLDFLRAWWKDQPYIGLVYMTGILPIKKYGTHSALNMFTEFSMTDAGALAEFVGFTEPEVRALCDEYNMNFDECKTWYDGYYFGEVGSVYNPRSVVQSMMSHKYNTYWNQTETFEALKVYISLNTDGLKDAIIALMAGDRQIIDTGKFVNDMVTFNGKDDVLTLLVHLGYLGYDFATSTVFIPNQEIRREYANATDDKDWGTVAKAVRASNSLLEATLVADAQTVAEGIKAAHLETSHITYNDENALAYTISLAYYTARNKYMVVREFPAGKGFADMVFLPRPQYMGQIPALVLELKWNKSAKAAIQQIKNKEYPHSLTDYCGSVLLVGINYDKTTREHECEIEKFTKV